VVRWNGESALQVAGVTDGNRNIISGGRLALGVGGQKGRNDGTNQGFVLSSFKCGFQQQK